MRSLSWSKKYSLRHVKQFCDNEEEIGPIKKYPIFLKNYFSVLESKTLDSEFFFETVISK